MHKRYEYTIHTIGPSLTTRGLDILGTAGWHVVAVIHDHDSTADLETTLLLEREVEDDS
jgi:hypothetical protein